MRQGTRSKYMEYKKFGKDKNVLFGSRIRLYFVFVWLAKNILCFNKSKKTYAIESKCVTIHYFGR